MFNFSLIESTLDAFKHATEGKIEDCSPEFVSELDKCVSQMLNIDSPTSFEVGLRAEVLRKIKSAFDDVADRLSSEVDDLEGMIGMPKYILSERNNACELCRHYEHVVNDAIKILELWGTTIK